MRAGEQATGVMPGSQATAERTGAGVRIAVDGYDETIELPNEVAVHVFVAR